MLYKSSYFNSLHIHALVTWLIICTILFVLPFFIKGLEKTKYSVFLGLCFIFMKIFDIFYRIHFEHNRWIDTFPLNLCNVSLIIAGIYFIYRKNILFNLVYFFFPGAILAVLLPAIPYYYTSGYMYVFIGTHMLEIFAVIFAFAHFDARVTKKGLFTALGLYLILSIISRIVNDALGTNYMFLNGYVLPALSFINSINIYAILLTLLFMVQMVLTYLPFLHMDNEDVIEETVKNKA